MAPRRKTRSMTNRLDASNPPALRKKAIRDETNVEEWIYRFLGNLAAIEKDKEEAKKRNMGFNTTDRSHSSKAARLRLRSPTPYAWSPLRHPIDSEDEEDNALITPMSRARVAKALSVDGPHMVHRDPTLLQKINRYIRAGIAEGKRRAKRYVRKALSFALETGYLVPVDRDGKLLRVSPALIAVGKPLVDARSRKSRRRRKKGRSGRVSRRRTGGRKRRTRGRRRHANEGGFKDASPAVPKTTANLADDLPIINESSLTTTTTNAKRKRSDEMIQNTMSSRERQSQKSRGGSRKSSGRPNTSPSRRRPIEDLSVLMPRTGSSETSDRKPLSARSGTSSFARRSRDDDIFA